MNWYTSYKKQESNVDVIRNIGIKSSWYKLAQYNQTMRSFIEEHAKSNTYPFSSWLGGSDRLYLPFDLVNNYKKNEQIDNYVKEELEEKGYKITDYAQGYCTKDGRNQLRIGKVLEKIKEQEIKKLRESSLQEEIINLDSKIEKTKVYYDDLSRTFQNSIYRSFKKTSSYYVVISQNPHDIAQMSTGRSWTSCMDLNNGERQQDIFCEVENGGLIAYLILEEDKNIEKPIARIRIRRFDSMNGTSIAVAENSVYGNDISGFSNFVKSWLKSKQPNIPADIYKLRGGSYSDTFDDKFLVLPEEEEEIKKWFHGKVDLDKFTEYEIVKNTTMEYENDDEYDDYFRGEVDLDSVDKVIARFKSLEEAKRWIEENYSENLPTQYTINKQVHLNDSKIKNALAKKIIDAPKGSYSKSLVLDIKNWVFGDDIIHSPLKSKIAKNFPELITEEDRNKLSQSEQRTYIENLTDSSLKQELINNLAEEAKENMSLNALLPHLFDSNNNMKDKTDNAPSDMPSSPSLALIDQFRSKIEEPLALAYKNRPINDNITEKLISFNKELLLKNEQNKYFPVADRAVDRVLASTVMLLANTNTDTPRVQNFYKELLSKWDFNEELLYVNNYDRLNLNTLGLSIAKLGPKNGKDFIPFFDEKLKQAQNKYSEIKRLYLTDPQKHKSQYQNISIFLERLLFTKELLETGKYSSKYYWAGY